MCDVTHSYVCYDASKCVTWIIHMWAVTHSHVWRAWFICVTWRATIQGVVTPLDIYDSRASFICVPWLTHICDVTHSYVWLLLTRTTQESSCIHIPLNDWRHMRFNDVQHVRLIGIRLDIWHTTRYITYDSIYNIRLKSLQCLGIHLPHETESTYGMRLNDIQTTEPPSFICVPWLIHMCGVTHS